MRSCEWGDCIFPPGSRCELASADADSKLTCVIRECSRDADCARGGVCLCTGSGSRCVAGGNCRIDADCGRGGYCSPVSGPRNCPGAGRYFCHTARDACTTDEDCSLALYDGNAYCGYDEGESRWECRSGYCIP